MWGKTNRHEAFVIRLGQILFLFNVLFALFSCKKESELGPSPPQSPSDELSSFAFSPDLKIELVASEPMIQDPVVISFDEAGRLWVVEMRGFMEDIEGKTENEKIGRVSVLEDTDNDGMMDSSTIYVDSLIMPRALAIVKGGALIAENEMLWLTLDIDGDLRADTKILIDSSYAGTPLPEHSGNGLWRGIDNWYYNVRSQLRYRLESGVWMRDSTEFRGQWGLSHDDEGRLIYNYNWSQLHADLVPPNYFSRNKNHRATTGIDHGLTTDRRIYPIRPNPAVNRGYVLGTLDAQGRLLEFTAACSPFYYRGTALPESYYGNVFVCEPSGNLIKRNIVLENGFYLSAYDPTPGKEFLASTDERFRPVYLSSGPDGALYLVDMYKGLIQHGKYITEYLREQTLSRKLDKPVHCGRIWRIVPKNWKRPNPVNLSKATSEELVKSLSSPDGWTRDISQRLLVEQNEPVTPTLLKTNILSNSNYLARLHSLWALQGLHADNADFLLRVAKDTNTLIRSTALRLLESHTLADKKVRQKLEVILLDMAPKATPKEILQVALTANVLDTEPSINLLAGIVERYDTSALMRDAVLSSLKNREFLLLQRLTQSKNWSEQKPAREILIEMLTTAIIEKRDPSELAALVDRFNKNPLPWQENAMLTALSIRSGNSFHPIVLSVKPKIFEAGKSNLDAKQLEILSGMFEWPGHKPKITAPTASNLDEAQLKQFTLGRQHYLTTCAGCHGTDGAGLSRFAPTLVGSEWVLGDEKRLALIVLHGMEGPLEVKGKRYDEPEILPVMPAHTPLDDEIITNILTYIRNVWGNNAGAMKPRTVGVTRNRSQGRVQPWTVVELEKYLKSIEGQE